MMCGLNDRKTSMELTSIVGLSEAYCDIGKEVERRQLYCSKLRELW